MFLNPLKLKTHHFKQGETTYNRAFTIIFLSLCEHPGSEMLHSCRHHLLLQKGQVSLCEMRLSPFA